MQKHNPETAVEIALSGQFSLSVALTAFFCAALSGSNFF